MMSIDVMKFRRVTRMDSGQKEPRAEELPDRYSIRSKGGDRELICTESRTLAVRIERGVSIPSSTARKAPPGSIYLDGAALGGPFLDAEKALFNLDHHEGCIRSFTLSTCEQAMVLTRKGLDLKGRDWTVYANDPDLDTVLAIWVLLNHVRLNDDNAEIRTRLMPLVRLEGTIDGHGLEMQELCGFTPEMQKKVSAELEQLRSKEVTLKKQGKWGEIDFLQYTADVLRAIDAMVYSSRHFEGVIKIEELSRAEIGENRLAVVCRSETGIYEIEPELRQLYGNRLGVIVLQKGSGTYTLRQVDMFLPSALESVYDRLNLMDPAAGNRRSGNRWGGSGEIGGSPRATGTALTPEQISEVLSQAYRRQTRAQRLGALWFAVLETAALMVGPLAATYFFGWLHNPAGSIEGYLRNHAGIYAGALCALAGMLSVAAIRRRRKLLGLCMPVGFDWLVLLPGALLGALFGGAWILPAALTTFRAILELHWPYIASAIAFPVAAEVLFRGLVHGMLAQHFPTQHTDGRWFVSWPVFISSTLYASYSALPFLPFFNRTIGLTFAGALLFGISSGMARERSESLLPCLILHWSCLLMLVVGSPLLLNRIGL
jgi:membrane protease YdiL (CAAX protease family)